MDVQLAQYLYCDFLFRKFCHLELGCDVHQASTLDRFRSQVIAVTRFGAESPFATYKQLDGMARTRFMGLAKTVTVYGLAVIVVNLRKDAKSLVLYGLPDSSYVG